MLSSVCECILLMCDAVWRLAVARCTSAPAGLLPARRATLSRYATRPTSSPKKTKQHYVLHYCSHFTFTNTFFPNCAWQWPGVLVHRATARRHTASHINNMYSHAPDSKPCYRYLLVTQPGHAEQAPHGPVVYLNTFNVKFALI